mgnify:CR=1 FL=1
MKTIITSVGILMAASAFAQAPAGPAGGGGAWKSAREVIAVASSLVPQAQVATAVTMFES